ncbi:hypothetical protein [Nonomuraea longicatena]|uniref:CPBP family intramembrane metalloprotease n=1 Tax=Nonomuraea longicatena TaxID=83682 RepID=A0ABN1PZL1_9ACTN
MRRSAFAVACSTLPFGFAASALLVVGLEWLAPDVIPFRLDTFLQSPLGFKDALTLIWPVLAVGVLMSLVFTIRSRDAQRYLARFGAEEGQVVVLRPFPVFVSSALEEIAFRFVLFYAAIAGARFMDFLVLGFADLHPVRWLFADVLVPVADFATAGRMREILLLSPWFVAAAVLASNGRFRNGHTYQGVLGWIFSWYFGMSLFLVMFEHGLPVAIAVHIFYNMTVVALNRVVTGVYPHLHIVPPTR